MKNENRLRILYIVSDLLCVSLAWFLFNIVRYNFIVESNSGFSSLANFLTSRAVLLGQVLMPIAMLAIFAMSGYYNSPVFRSRIEEALNTFITTLIGTLVAYFATLVNDNIPDKLRNYEMLLIIWGLFFTITYAARCVITTATARRIKAGHIQYGTLIIGTSSRARALAKRLDRTYRMEGFAALTPGSPDEIEGHEVIPADDIEAFVIARDVSRIIIVPSEELTPAATVAMISRLFPLNCSLIIPPDIYHLLTTRARFENVIGEPLIDISAPTMSPATANIKRVVDVCVSAIALTVLSPLMLAVAIAVKLDSRGPVFYRQERIGFHKKPFTMYKFRSMCADAEADGPALASEHDSRITRLGRALRKYRLDELPQFWNVLKGDMSIVGPRPERAFFINQIVKRAPYYALIHRVRPGITSWGMVKYGYAKDVDQMIERLSYDLLYLENVSAAVDLKIIFHTISTVLGGRGM